MMLMNDSEMILENYNLKFHNDLWKTRNSTVATIGVHFPYKIVFV